MHSEREYIVVVGFGWVGQANALALREMGYPVAYFDTGNPPHHYEGYPYEKLERLSEVGAKDSAGTVYLVCVGDRVSEEGEQDLSSIKGALESVKGLSGTVVLRSTVLPDRLEELPFDFYVPEFLHEKTAVEECMNPFYFVVGKKTDKEEPSIFKDWRSRTGLIFNGTPKEAAFVKYLSNLWNATRIAFVNEFGDIIAAPCHKEDIESIERVMNFVLRGDPYLKYGRSFGGHCLPKDMRAFASWYEKKGESVELLKGAYRANDAHTKTQSQYPLLPEWFSAWPIPHISGLLALRELLFSVRKNVFNPKPVIDRYIKRRRS